MVLVYSTVDSSIGRAIADSGEVVDDDDDDDIVSSKSSSPPSVLVASFRFMDC